MVRALVALPSCAEVVMVNRKATPLASSHRVWQVIVDTAAAEFPVAVTELAMSIVAFGNPVLWGHLCRRRQRQPSVCGRLYLRSLRPLRLRGNYTETLTRGRRGNESDGSHFCAGSLHRTRAHSCSRHRTLTSEVFDNWQQSATMNNHCAYC